ncbi:MAG: hypothetical protein KY469_10670 [Actinobacteria bacterium]|nr:hypothetical protein [Actinomycetota bacterium]
MTAYTFVWINTLRAERWEREPGPCLADIHVAALAEADRLDATLTGELDVQVSPDPALPDGLVKVVASAPVTVRGAWRLDRSLERTRRRLRRELEQAAAMEQGHRILQAVAGAAGLDPSAVTQDDRSVRVTAVRRRVAVECRDAGLTLSQIGEVLDRDHTTVLHALRREGAA